MTWETNTASALPCLQDSELLLEARLKTIKVTKDIAQSSRTLWFDLAKSVSHSQWLISVTE